MAESVSPELLALQQALIGRYSLERELGRGGMGIVFLARDVALDRLVAIKLLPPHLAHQPGTRERFLREAQMSARLSHPNIVPIYQVEQQGDLVYFVMAFVEGETLGQRVRAKGPLNPAQATRLLQEVAWALAYAHLRGIVHRDIKPDNIMIEAGTGRALVNDFGIARATETSGGTQVGEILGTAHYMSPEQACGEKVDGRSDLYSLGVVGFFALSGRLPFDAPDIPALLAQHITRPPPPVASVTPGLPQKLAQAIDRCLVKDVDQRWQSGEQFAEALSQSTAVSREIPAPIRVWLTKGDGARSVLYGWTILVGGGSVVEFLVRLFQGAPRVDGDNVVAVALPWLIFLLYRLYHGQRVIMAGYGYEDLRQALRQQVESRREELAFEYDRDPPIWARAIRKLSFAALGVMGATAAYVWIATAPDPSLTAYLMGISAAVAAGGAIIGRLVPGKRLKARDSTLEYRVKLLDSRLGRFLFRLAGVGVKPGGSPGALAHRPTEVAIGMAAEALFEALPREARKELKDLPDVIKRLEADAQAQRARVEELNAALAGLDGGAPRAASSSLRGDAGAVIAEQQRKLHADITVQRDAAVKRMAASVAALENLRLDLLRLTAGAGSLDELTSHLSDARRLQDEIALAIEARRETEAALLPRADA